jgi:hypothetical protein
MALDGQPQGTRATETQDSLAHRKSGQAPSMRRNYVPLKFAGQIALKRSSYSLALLALMHSGKRLLPFERKPDFSCLRVDCTVNLHLNGNLTNLFMLLRRRKWDTVIEAAPKASGIGISVYDKPLGAILKHADMGQINKREVITQRIPHVIERDFLRLGAGSGHEPREQQGQAERCTAT